MIQVISAGVGGLVLGLALATTPNPQRAMLVTLFVGVAVLAGLWTAYRSRQAPPPAPSPMTGTPPAFVARVAAASTPERDAAQERQARERRAELERWAVLREMVELSPNRGLGRRAWAGQRTRAGGVRVSQGSWQWAFNTLRAANAIRQDAKGWKLAAEPAAILTHFGLAPTGTGRLFVRSGPPPEAQNLVRV